MNVQSPISLQRAAWSTCVRSRSWNASTRSAVAMPARAELSVV